MDLQDNLSAFAPLPALEGFSFRHFSDSDDYPDVVDIIMSNIDDPDPHATTVADISMDYAHLAESVLTRDVILVHHQDAPVAYARTGCNWEEYSQSWIYNSIIHVHKNWKWQSVEDALVGWLEAQTVRNHQNLHADADGQHSVFLPERNRMLLNLLLNSNYLLARFFNDMKRDLEDMPDYQLPDGIVVRPALPSQYRQVCDAGVEAFQDHWGSTIPTEEDYQEWLANKNYFQPYLWQIAWDRNEIAGMVLNFINLTENQERGLLRGDTEGISVRRPWRGKGIAKALICRSMKMMKALGMTEVALGMDSQNINGATKLYYGLGYRSYNRSVVLRKPLID